MNPALATGWYFWRRTRGTTYGLLGAIALLALLNRLPSSPLQQNLVMSGALLTGMGLLSLIVAFTYQESNPTKADVMAGGSAFPVSMLVLPVRTRDLVLWPVGYAAIAQLGIWIPFAKFVLVPQGFAVDLVWPGLAMVAFTTSVQASSWAKFPVPVGNLIWALGGLGVVTGLSIVTGLGVFSKPVGYGAFLLFIGVNVATSLWGLQRARVGVDVWRMGGRRVREVVEKPPFRSGFRSQLWLEVRRNGSFLPGFVVLACITMGLITIFGRPDLPGELGSTGIEIPGGRMIFLVCVPLAVMFSSAMGTSPCKVDNFTPSFGLQPFFASRPLSTATLAAAKLVSGAISSLVTSLLLATAVGFWSLSPAQFGGVTTTVAAALGSYLGSRVLPLSLFAFALLFLSVWKVAVAISCSEITGRRWIGGSFVFFVGALIVALPILWLYFHQDPQWIKFLLRQAPGVFGALLVLKLVVCVLGLFVARKGEAAIWRFCIWALGGWALGVGLLTAVLGALLPPGVLNSGQLLGGSVLFIPLNRVLWTPSAMAWNRHR